MRRALESVAIPVLGALPRHAPIAMPERHLGLVQAEEQTRLRADRGSRALRSPSISISTRCCDFGMRLDRAAVAANGVTPPGQRIALARDAAFSFIYPHMLEGWRAAGAELLPFSPLADEGPDANADVCWLPGGYPELHAGRLAANDGFRQALRSFAETRPVHGECGGYMVLGTALVDADGTGTR